MKQSQLRSYFIQDIEWVYYRAISEKSVPTQSFQEKR